MRQDYPGGHENQNSAPKKRSSYTVKVGLGDGIRKVANVISYLSGRVNCGGVQQDDKGKSAEDNEISNVREECQNWWVKLSKELEIRSVQELRRKQEVFQTAFQQQAGQRAQRSREVKRSDTIRNAYFAEGGIYHQLDRLSECFELADATGRELAIEVVFTILLELDHDLKQLTDKLKKLEQSEADQPELDRRERKILELITSVALGMDKLNVLKLQELKALRDNLEVLHKSLEQQDGLPAFTEGENSEALWQTLRELAEKLHSDDLGDDVVSEAGKTCIRETAEAVKQVSETKILPKWNRYAATPKTLGAAPGDNKNFSSDGIQSSEEE